MEIYAEQFGLSVESDVKKLKECFRDEKWNYYQVDHKVYIGKVDYYDDNSHWMPQGNLFYAHMHKRNEFSYENELRCIVSDSTMPAVVRPTINLETLITAIPISPFAPDWYTEVIKSLCEKYGLNPTLVTRSSLKVD